MHPRHGRLVHVAVGRRRALLADGKGSALLGSIPRDAYEEEGDDVGQLLQCGAQHAQARAKRVWVMWSKPPAARRNQRIM